jgi:hypothetical protein
MSMGSDHWNSATKDDWTINAKEKQARLSTVYIEPKDIPLVIREVERLLEVGIARWSWLLSCLNQGGRNEL